MKETLTYDKPNWTGGPVKVVIDRDTGEFDLYDTRFTLKLQYNVAALMMDNEEVPVCVSTLRGNIWHFEEMGIVKEDSDPFNAAIQIACDIVEYYIKNFNLIN
jgi:hypothetical protein